MDKRYLYYIAGLIWGLPGVMITIKGIRAYTAMPAQELWWLGLITAGVLIGFIMMFSRIVNRYCALITLLLCACVSCAQVSEGLEKTKVYQGFSGGMMLHTGCLFGRDSHAPLTPSGRSTSPQGGLIGIGGALRVHLWKHLRTGFEGFVSTMPSGMTDCRDILKPGSYVRVGCGGALADCCWRLEKAWPYIGGVIGGGSMKGLYILEGDENSWAQDANSTFHKQSFFYVTPYVGCDYCLTRKVHITFRLDWMLAFHHHELTMPTGPRLYFGFMFCH